MKTPLSALSRSVVQVAFALCTLTLFVLAAPKCAAAVGPVITNVTYSPNPIPVAGGQVTVTAKVTDSTAALSSVNLKEGRPGYGYPYRSAPMAVGSDGVTYTATIPVDLNGNSQANGESLAVVATDNASNTATSNVATQGYSNTAPVIGSVTYGPNPIPARGAYVTISAKVTDALLGLSSVTLKEGRPGYGYPYRSAPMAVGSDGVTYTATIPVDLNTNNGANGESLTITAIDPAGNETDRAVATQGYSNIAPIISPPTFSPDPLPIQGANVTVKAKVTDAALGLSSVVLYEARPGYGYPYRSAPMAVGNDGVTYTATIPVDLNGNNGANGESLGILATDPAGNSTFYSVATQGYSNQPPFGSLPVLISGDPASSVLYPTSVAAGGPELTLDIHGINFASGATVLFNGVNLPTTSQTSTRITVNVPASLIEKPGSYAVSVLDPSPSGASNSVNLIVN